MKQFHKQFHKRVLSGKSCVTTRISKKKKKKDGIITYLMTINLTASSEFGTYRLCEQRRFRRA